jgi:agmatinase
MNDKNSTTDTRTSQKSVPRYIGISTFMGQPHSKDVSSADVAIVGIPFETGSAPGNIYAPRHVREVSWLLRSSSPAHHINLLEELNIVDYGDMAVFTGDVESSFPVIVSELTGFLNQDVIPISIGGDHSITYAGLKAMHEFYPDLALIHIDSHPDTHDVYFGNQRYTAGSFARRAVEDGFINPARSVQVGLRGTMYSIHDFEQSRELGFETITMDEVSDIGIAETVARIRDRVGSGKVFLTFDMDSVDPAFAPGTARPEPGGFTSREILRLIRGLAGLDFVGFDTSEVNPLHDSSNLTSVLAANVIFEFLGLIAIQKR